MDEAHKELVKRLRRTVYRSDWDDTPVYANPDGVDAADALEAMAGEVEQWRAAFNKLQERALTKEQALADCTAERDRLKAVLKPRLNAKAIEGLQEILEAMEAMDEREAPFLKTLLDWHEAARKALGDAS